LYNDEILYSDAKSRTGASLVNNVSVVTTTGKNAIGNAAGISQSNNVTNALSATFFGVPGATNVDFNLTSSATAVIDKGTTSNAPSSDIGFDPKYIKRGALSGSNLPSWLSASSLPSWWTYVIDYDYIHQAPVGRARTALAHAAPCHPTGSSCSGSLPGVPRMTPTHSA